MNNLNKKNILFLTHDYSTFTKDQIEEIAKYFNKVYVLFRYKPIAEISNFINFPYLNIYKKSYVMNLNNVPKNIEVIPIPLWYLPTDFFYKKIGEWHFKAVDKIIEKNKIHFDLIHAHFAWSAGFVGKKLKEKYNKPLIITGHGYDVYYLPFKNFDWRRRMQSVFNAANFVITVSKSNYLKLKKLQINSIINIINNGYDEKLFFPKIQKICRKSLKIDQNKKILLSIGSLEKVKGHSYLIEAMSIINKTHKNILLYIIGDGALRYQLQKQIVNLKLGNIITLLGSKKREDLIDWINCSDIFILPSISESFGVVQIEALACGKPIVATKNGGSEEIIISNNIGILCKKQDITELSNAIEKALIKKWNSKYLITYSRKYQIKNICKKIVDVYSRV